MYTTTLAVGLKNPTLPEVSSTPPGPPSTLPREPSQQQQSQQQQSQQQQSQQQPSTSTNGAIIGVPQNGTEGAIV